MIKIYKFWSRQGDLEVEFSTGTCLKSPVVDKSKGKLFMNSVYVTLTPRPIK